MSGYVEVLPGKFVNQNNPIEIFLKDLNYFEVGKRYVVRQGTYLYNYTSPTEEISVEEFSPDKKYVKLSGRWEKTEGSPGYYILSEIGKNTG